MAAADQQQAKAAAQAQPRQQDVRNPITGRMIGRITMTPVEEIPRMVTRARRAQADWAQRTVRERARLIRRWADTIWEDQQTAIDVIRRETGKSEHSALSEVLGLDLVANYYVRSAPRILRSRRRTPTLPLLHRARVHYRPHGVVGLIAPWNFPFALTFIDAVPALIAGNAVILKPSEITPFSAEYGMEVMHRVGLPEGLVQIAHGDGEVGAAVVDHVDYLAFTGSTETGRQVAVRAAGRLIPYSLELGGKDPLIVLPGADLDMAATAMLRGAFENAGQYCMSVERAYVHEAIYDTLLERLQHYAAQYTVGSGDGAEALMGSLTRQQELERLQAHLQDALNRGAKVIHGGKARPDLGPLFFEPTVLVDVDHRMDVMQEETFGPILPIMKVKDEAEALRLANDSGYGLAAAIFTRDMAAGERTARLLNSGDVTVNGTQLVIGTPSLPSGGQGLSGVGRRNGPEGMLRFVSIQSILSNTGRFQKPDLMLLNRRNMRMVRLLRRLRRWVPFL